MEKRFQKFILAVLTLSFLALPLSGCDFFGKKDDESETKTADKLPDGSSVLGTWIDLKVATSASNNPQSVLAFTYTFSANQSLSIEVRDPHRGGFSCVAYGQYRLDQNRLSLFIQASTPNCPYAFSSYQYWGEVERKSASLTATDPVSHTKSTYLLSGSGSGAVTGLWNFQGEAGIDWIWLDTSGYFILQTTDAGKMYLLLGFFYIGGATNKVGGLTLAFIENMDPSQPPNSGLQFEQFITDGSTLVIYETMDANSNFYTGTRL